MPQAARTHRRAAPDFTDCRPPRLLPATGCKWRAASAPSRPARLGLRVDTCVWERRVPSPGVPSGGSRPRLWLNLLSDSPSPDLESSNLPPPYTPSVSSSPRPLRLDVRPSVCTLASGATTDGRSRGASPPLRGQRQRQRGESAPRTDARTDRDLAALTCPSRPAAAAQARRRALRGGWGWWQRAAAARCAACSRCCDHRQRLCRRFAPCATRLSSPHARLVSERAGAASVRRGVSKD